MVKAAIRLCEVPAEFREQAHDKVYICEHFYSKVVDSTKIPNEEIGCIGFLSDRPAMPIQGCCV